MNRQFRIQGDRLELTGDTFPIKDRIKELGGRWDRIRKIWTVPHDEGTTQCLLALHFLPLETEEPKQDAMTPVSTETALDKTWTVSEFLGFVDAVITRHLGFDFWIAGEITSLRISNGHTYFELAESADEMEQSRLRRPAAASGVLWAGIRKTLSERHGELPLTEGLRVRIKTNCELRREGGRLTLVVQDVDVAYTLGDLALIRQKIVRELRQRGLYDRNRQRHLPPFPLHLVLITACGSRAESDFVDEIRNSGIAFRLTVIDAHMQGEATSSEVCRALTMAGTITTADCIVITRGGGSRLDLRWFDDLEIAKAIAYANVPIITAIGHFDDVSIADEVAFLAEKTPTGAGRFLANRIAESWTEVESRVERLAREATRRLQKEHTGITQLEARLGGAARRAIGRENQKIEGFQQTLRLLRASVDRVLARGFALVRNHTGEILTSEDFLGDHPPREISLELRNAQADNSIRILCEVTKIEIPKSKEIRDDL